MGGESWPGKLSAVAATIAVAITLMGGVLYAGMWVCAINHRTSSAPSSTADIGGCPERMRPVGLQFTGRQTTVTCAPE